MRGPSKISSQDVHTLAPRSWRVWSPTSHPVRGSKREPGQALYIPPRTGGSGPSSSFPCEQESSFPWRRANPFPQALEILAALGTKR